MRKSQMAIGLVLCALLSSAGCGGGTSDPQVAPPEEAPRVASTPEPASDKPSPAERERAAEAEVRAEFGSEWVGIRARVRDASTLCVDYAMTKRRAKALGLPETGRNNHVIVDDSFGYTEIGEPQDGTCARPAPDPDERVPRARLDAMAERLDAAIAAYQQGGPARPLLALAGSIRRTINGTGSQLPVTSKSANLIVSATGALLIDEGYLDPAQLAAARRYLNEALAE